MNRFPLAFALMAIWIAGLTSGPACGAVFSPATRSYSLACDLPEVELVAQADGSVCPVAADGRWMLGLDAPGAPAVPRRTFLFAAPDGMTYDALAFDVEWAPLAENVRLAPQPEAVRDGEDVPATSADPVAYDVELHPAAAAVAEDAVTMDGVTVIPVTVAPVRWSPRTGLLERARAITLSVTFRTDATAVSRPWSDAHRALVREAVANPEALEARMTVDARVSRAAGRKVAISSFDAIGTIASAGVASTGVASTGVTSAGVANAANTSEPGLYRTDTSTNAFDYLLISPPDFFGDWCWYVRERQAVHTNLRFAVKNTAVIYGEFPFAPSNDCRNAAESIHAYLRQAVSNGVRYVVLGGAWLDAQNLNNYTPYFTTGEAMTLSNSVPGVYGFPRESWRQIPADLFYGCLDMNKGQKYPWDMNGDGKYIDQNDCWNNDTYPDVCVSRITLNPHNPRAGAYDRHALVTNYVEKLARGEARYFGGHYRYGMSVASTGSSKLRKSGDRMCYRELEFYDGMYNMFDPRHHDSLEDGEYSTRWRYYEQFSEWRPIRSVKGMMNYTWTGGQPTLAAAMDDYYAGDRDFGYVQAHGWAQGAAQFSAYRFAMATGLTLFNGGSGPCETGYPDYHVSSGGKKVLQYNVGDAAVSNPDGGALASVNNSRWSWAGGGGGFAAMSYYMLNEMLIGFNKERLDVGHAWMKGVRNYWPAGKGGGTAGWVLTEQFLYGDPLVRLPELPNVWWTGGASGVWDRVTSNWTNSVDGAKTFDAASNVYFDVQSKLALDVAGEIAAMRLSLPVWQEDAVLTLAGTGSLRVMQSVDVSGTNTTLRFGVAGGVGHNGIRFLTGAGDLVFEGTNRFYVGGVSNAKAIALRGGGVTLDVDEFPAGDFPIAIDGSREPSIPLANELRSKTAGGLCRFGSLAITNSHVKLSTVDAFGNGTPMTHALVDSELEIAANVYYQRSGFPEGLNATFLVDGESEVSSSLGGLWTVKHVTTFVLGAGRRECRPNGDTRLTLSADTVNAGGKIVITNAATSAADPQPPTSNTVVIANASALAGDVTIGAGIRLVLRELPLASVTSLTVGEGATVELPDDASGYWQIVPVSSKFSCGENVTFVTASNPTNRLDGSPSPTGSFFREGALYRWTGTEDAWDVYFANRHPKILFGDIVQPSTPDEQLSTVTVRVATAVSPDFAFFSNLKTKYVYASAADGASVLFSSICFCGPTEFDVPVFATEYADISTSTSRFSSVSAPYVHVAAGAGLALAGSHWTEFRLDANAFLVAVPNETLDWNGETSFTYPEQGEVLVDIGALEPLTSTPVPLVTGQGHVWTLTDLKHLRLVQTNAELRIVGGALCVAAGDNLKGPYELFFTGATNWNTAAWTAGSNAFPRVWADCALDWAADAVVTVSNLQPSTFNLQPATLAADCDVHLQTLTIHAGTNDFALSRCAREDASTTGRFSVATLDLTDCHGTTEIGVETGDAAILAASSTNGTDVVRLRCAGSGTIDLAGVTLILDRPGAWSLTAGAQGTLRVVAPQAYERFRVAKVPDGFKAGGLTVAVTDSSGRTIDGFRTDISDGALWCVPPSLRAVVPPGTNDLSRLEWRDVLGNVVSNVDWTLSAGFQLIGTPASGVVIAKNGFASVWNHLSVSNDVTVYGCETLTPSQIPGGSGVLTLAGAFTVNADLGKYPSLLNDSHLCLSTGVVMNVSHGGANLNASGQNWKGLVGTGKIVFTDSRASWIALPGNLFAPTLSVGTASDIVLTQNIGVSNPFAVRNLSGTGSFRTDWGDGNWRPIATEQTGVSAFSGTLTAKAGSRDSTLIVSSDAAEATTEKALILSGAAVAVHELKIERTGCVILTGSWMGEIKVEGLLVITNACATNAVQVTVAEGGEVRTVAENEIPAVTGAPEYVAPTYPDDSGKSEEQPSADTRVRILTAQVGDGLTTWTRLDWRDTNGNQVVGIDWPAVTNATIVATNGPCRVIADAAEFAGVVRLERVTVEARKVCPFTLAADSVGTVDFRLDPVPTATCDLLNLQPSTANLQPSTSVTLYDRYGRVPDVAGEVTFDGSAGRYRFYVQNVDRPNYSHLFDTQYDESLPSCGTLFFSGSGNLTWTAHPGHFESSRGGRALKGSCTGSFGNMYSHNGGQTFSMNGVTSVSLNVVAKLPANDTGVIIGLGNKHGGNGLALARKGANVAGVYVWTNGGAVRLAASANVAFASEQFHSYAVTHDGTTLRFYVDGVLAEETALEGQYPSTGYYQWFNVYGGGGGLSGGSTSSVDDFRLYLNCCLTPASVRTIANGFPPWPELPTAEVDVADLAWSNLYWSADSAAGGAVSLVAGAGSLWFDAPVTVTNPLAVTGGCLPLRLEGDGALIVTRGLVASSPLEIDASGLDGTNLASFAVAGAPYSRWLVKGACTGLAPTVTAMPEVPNRYTVHAELVAGYGLRLVVTAPRTARFGSVNLNFAGGKGGANCKVAESCVSSDATQSARAHGAHPVLGADWNDLSAGNVTEPAPRVVRTDGTLQEDAAVTVRVSQVKNPYVTGKSVADRILWGYADDGLGPIAEISGVPFARYRAIVYRSTDNDGAVFNPVRIGTTPADAKRYFGPNAGTAAGGHTLSGETDVNWGWANARDALTEGANYVVSDVLTGGTVYVSSPKLSTGRACLAAIQIVEVGSVVDSKAVDYAAVVTNDTAWANGEGSGLADHGLWVNDPAGEITLTQSVASATVTFDTPVTADVVRIVNDPGERLRLDSTGADFDIAELDATAARGELVFGEGWATLPPIEDASGSRIRFERDVTDPCRVTPGAVYSYRTATFASPVASWAWTLQLGESGDRATFPKECYLSIGAMAGTLTLGPSSGTLANEYCYGGTKASSGTNSVLTVRGGTVVCNVAGTGTDNGGSTRGLIVGTTSSATRAPRIFVESGTFDCSKGILSPWELCRIVQRGGLIRARGIWKGGGTPTAIDLDGGLLELGGAGIGRRTGSGGAFEIELEGGEIRAVETSSVNAPTVLAVAAPSALSATNGATLTVAATLAGAGDLAIGSAGATGTVRLEATDGWTGDATVRAGATLEIVPGGLHGAIAFETNAVLNLVVSDGLVDDAYPLATNLVALCGDDLRRHIRVNGEELPSYCEIVGGTIVTHLEALRWANPVTGEEKTFFNLFAGATDGEWSTLANWSTYGSVYQRWIPLSGTRIPFMQNGLWTPAVIDGGEITNVAARTVHLTGAMEGWTLRLALYNSVTVTVDSVNKFQCSGGEQWVWVDATSKLIFSACEGSGNSDGALSCSVAAPEGLVFTTKPKDDMGFEYYLKGEGSVVFGEGVKLGMHALRRADFTLSRSGLGRAVREKTLVAFPASSTGSFALTGATVDLVDPTGEYTAGVLKDSVSADDAVGSYALTQRVDGVSLLYVDRAEGLSYVHEVADGGDVRQVEIPVDWLMQLTNGSGAALSPDVLTPAKVSSALESTLVPNGIRPWTSYVLGLEPTNAADRVSAVIAHSDGKVRVEARGLDDAKFRCGVRVRYALQATDDLAKDFQTIREAQETSLFENISTNAPTQFYRIRIDLCW